MNDSTQIFPLDPRQLSLFQSLSEKDSSIAQIYLGSLYVLQQQQNPARFSLAAHGFRELMEKMPKCYEISIKTPISLGVKVREIYNKWKRLGPLTFVKSNIIQFTNKKPNKLLKSIDEFFVWYENNASTRKDQLKYLLRELDPSKRPISNALEEIVGRLWNTMREYFNGIAHHDKQINQEEFFKYLYELEEFLLDRLIPRTFDDISEIDAIIGVDT